MITTMNLTKETKELRNYNDIINDILNSNDYLDILDYEFIKNMFITNNKEVAYIPKLNRYVIVNDLEKHINEFYFIAVEYDDIIEYIKEEYGLYLPEYYFS